MFRIDRRLVNISGVKFKNFDELVETDENPEADAEGEVPDTEASEESEAAAEAASTKAAEVAVNEYLNAARSETEAKISEAEEKIEKLLEKAREDAAQIVLDAHDDAEEERQKGYREGFEEGSEEGKRKYDEKIAEKIKEDDATLKRVLDELYDERERTNSALEGETVDLAVEIVRKIINPPEESLGDIFTPLIKNALRQMSTDGKIVLRVGPDEYERFFSSGAATIELDSGVTVRASVLRDVSLQEGDLIIDTDDVTINAGIDSQLQFVQLAFERANQYEPE